MYGVAQWHPSAASKRRKIKMTRDYEQYQWAQTVAVWPSITLEERRIESKPKGGVCWPTGNRGGGGS